MKEKKDMGRYIPPGLRERWRNMTPEEKKIEDRNFSIYLGALAIILICLGVIFKYFDIGNADSLQTNPVQTEEESDDQAKNPQIIE